MKSQFSTEFLRFFPSIIKRGGRQQYRRHQIHLASSPLFSGNPAFWTLEGAQTQIFLHLIHENSLVLKEILHNLKSFCPNSPLLGHVREQNQWSLFRSLEAAKTPIRMWWLPCWDLLSHNRQGKRCLNLPFISLYPPLLLSYAGFPLLTHKHEGWNVMRLMLTAASRACQTTEDWVPKDDVWVGVSVFDCSQKE